MNYEGILKTMETKKVDLNTPDNKAKFIAQYWGQKIGSIIINESDQKHDYQISSGNILALHYINLKPISSISDEDAIEICKIFKIPNFVKNISDVKSEYEIMIKCESGWDLEIFYDLSGVWINDKDGKNIDSPIMSEYWKLLDYLRSRGYALPWNGITVEQQIELGWIKLTS